MIDKIKKQIDIIDSDLKLGRINNQKISDFARIPLGDMEKIRLQIDPKNFMELKKYVNK